MPQTDLDVLVIVGSPHERGKSAHVAQAIEQRLSRYGVKPTVWDLAEHPVAGCYNCKGCQLTGNCRIVNDPFPVLARHMVSADLAFLVAPVYFAGPPAHLKALLDRCQMFWARKYVLKRDVPPKRPLHLIVLGDGGDPFGSEPLETSCTSAMNCANLRIEGNIHRIIGREFEPGELEDIVDGALRDIGWLEQESAR